jgi:tripartite-type tricarboxylate transporter receptor subunit TctC
MKFQRRRFLHLAAGAVALPAVSRAARAQTYPTRPITMIVTFAAGGPNDVIAPIMASRMSELLNQRVVVENVTGAGGMTGAARVAKATPDGYQFVIAGPGIYAFNQTLYKNPLYNAATDFAPVGLFAEVAEVLITRKDLPVGNLREFMAYAKENPSKMLFGSGGAGSGDHIACVLLNSAIGVNVTHVPYRGGGPAMQDLQGSRIDYMCDALPAALPQVEAKTVKAIATLARERASVLPDVATAHEQGLTDFDTSITFAFLLPKGTPDPIVRRLNKAMSDAVDTPAVRQRLRTFGTDVVPPERRTPEYLTKYIPSEIEKWARPIRASGILMD